MTRHRRAPAVGRGDTRCGTVSFDDPANLDDGEMWPVSFAVIEMTAKAEKRIRELVRTAVS